MIAVDTSALIAIALDEPEAARCMDALTAADQVLISAGTMAEALVVASGRGVAGHVAQLFETFPFEVVPVTRAVAVDLQAAYVRWGKGSGAARLNFGDCFAYVVATSRGIPLLYVGDDFTRTDVRAAE